MPMISSAVPSLRFGMLPASTYRRWLRSSLSDLANSSRSISTDLSSSVSTALRIWISALLNAASEFPTARDSWSNWRAVDLYEANGSGPGATIRPGYCRLGRFVALRGLKSWLACSRSSLISKTTRPTPASSKKPPSTERAIAAAVIPPFLVHGSDRGSTQRRDHLRMADTREDGGYSVTAMRGLLASAFDAHESKRLAYGTRIG
jgi:hypothetical protein